MTALNLKIVNEQSPMERADEKLEEALKWLNRWGYTTPAILGSLVQLENTEIANTPTQQKAATEQQGRRLAQRMQIKGLVKTVLTGGNWGFWKYTNDQNGVRKKTGPFLLILTELGKGAAQSIDVGLGAPHNRQVHGVQSIRHNLICQTVTIEYLKRGFSDYEPEASRRTESKSGVKQPDCILIKDDGRRVALEIELSPKRGAPLDRALISVCKGLETGRFDFCIYLFASAVASEIYESIWANRKLQIWQNKNGKWFENGFYDVHQAVASRVKFAKSEILLGGIF